MERTASKIVLSCTSRLIFYHQILWIERLFISLFIDNAAKNACVEVITAHISSKNVVLAKLPRRCNQNYYKCIQLLVH
jgi:hypothetical protein